MRTVRRVAYFLDLFPAVTDPFILNELLTLERKMCRFRAECNRLGDGLVNDPESQMIDGDEPSPQPGGGGGFQTALQYQMCGGFTFSRPTDDNDAIVQRRRVSPGIGEIFVVGDQQRFPTDGFIEDASVADSAQTYLLGGDDVVAKGLQEIDGRGADALIGETRDALWRF